MTSNEGTVYILTNPSLPSLVKIGYTTRTAAVRAKELSNTSVPTAYEVRHETKKVADCRAVERRVHEALKGCRVDARKEFFECSVEEAVAAIESVLEPQPLPPLTNDAPSPHKTIVVPVDQGVETITIQLVRTSITNG